MWLLLLSCGLTVFTIATLGYVISQIINDASFADVAWGAYFISMVLSLAVFNDQWPPIQMLVSALVVVWALRLTWYIARRRIGQPEDWRYAEWRRQWGKSFAIRSYFQNFLLQGALAIVIALPVIVATKANTNQGGIQAWQIVGACVWTFGFLFESIADRQLRRFKKAGGGIMTKGLWSLSRHPNYFGEIVQWTGLFIIVAPLPYGWRAVASPMVVAGLLIFVSGIPLLERKYKNNEDYQKYADRTSALIPLPPKKP